MPRKQLQLLAYRSPSDYRSPQKYNSPDDYSKPRESSLGQHPPTRGKPAGGAFWNYNSPQPYTSPQPYAAPAGYSGEAYNAAGGTGGSDGNGKSGGGGGGGRDGQNGGGGGSSSRGPLKWLTVLFALLVAVGGVMGYIKKGSVVSLAASGSIAGTLLLAAYLMAGPAPTHGLQLAFVSTMALASYMGYGYYRTRKPFPQGVFTVLSAVLSIAYATSLF
ncbi:hypothetical protein WJX72_001072 [[Myrmecia] bisecta]|uniref:Transmembrane protein 14C n=1 Tax=[Myrmecia] bisecta TaxID=41462 RepID=A0AAW1Q4L6_9CHLO